MKTFGAIVLALLPLLLGAACTEPDLSTPEGRAEHARIRAVADEINKHKWDSFPTYTPTPMVICSGYTSTSGYISGGQTTLICQ